MDQELVARLARDAGFLDWWEIYAQGLYEDKETFFAKFAALVAEECAKICTTAAGQSAALRREIGNPHEQLVVGGAEVQARKLSDAILAKFQMPDTHT